MVSLGWGEAILLRALPGRIDPGRRRSADDHTPQRCRGAADHAFKTTRLVGDMAVAHEPGPMVSVAIEGFIFDGNVIELAVDVGRVRGGDEVGCDRPTKQDGEAETTGTASLVLRRTCQIKVAALSRTFNRHLSGG